MHLFCTVRFWNAFLTPLVWFNLHELLWPSSNPIQIIKIIPFVLLISLQLIKFSQGCYSKTWKEHACLCPQIKLVFDY